MQNVKPKRDDLKQYKIAGKLTILELMSLLAILGILVAVISANYF
jgi:Tfp pilus assembly protein PilE